MSLMVPELAVKRLELLRELVAGISRVSCCRRGDRAGSGFCFTARSWLKGCPNRSPASYGKCGHGSEVPGGEQGRPLSSAHVQLLAEKPAYHHSCIIIHDAIAGPVSITLAIAYSAMFKVNRPDSILAISSVESPHQRGRGSPTRLAAERDGLAHLDPRYGGMPMP